MGLAFKIPDEAPPNLYGLHGYTKTRKRDQADFSARARRLMDELARVATVELTPGCEVAEETDHDEHTQAIEEYLGQIAVTRQSLEASVGERRFRLDLRRFAPSLVPKYQTLRIAALDRLGEHEAFLRDAILGEGEDPLFPESGDEPASGPSVAFEM